MRTVSVALGGQSLTLRIPVPSKALRLLSALKGDVADLERASVSLLAQTATAWPWGDDPETAWAAMWDAGVSWQEVVAATQAFGEAVQKAMGLVAEAATEAADTFRGAPDGVGGDAP